MEGHDQYRGWFNSSLLVAVANRERPPYDEVITHGFTLDGQGQKMSKSLGNVISPQDVVGKMGADVLRMWVSMVNYIDDMRLSDEILDRNVEAYRKIRNTFRYFLSNIHDFDPGRDAVELTDLVELDRWAMTQLEDLTVGMVSSFEGYEFHAAHHALHNFCAVTMSSLYLDILKDRLYTSVPTSRERRSAQTTLYRIAHAVCRLMAPILPFTAEEIWAQLPKEGSDPESVHVALFPKPGISERMFAGDPKAAADFRRSWEKLLALREQVTRALEAERRSGAIGSALEAAVTLAAAPEVAGLLRDHLADLPALFIVSKVDLEKAPLAAPAAGSTTATPGSIQDLVVSVRPAPGAKCARCWNIKETVGQDSELPELCDRCREAVREILVIRGGVH